MVYIGEVMHNVCLLSGKRCGSTVTQEIAHYVLYKEDGIIQKHHNDISLNQNQRAIVNVRNPIDQFLSLYRVFKIDKNKIDHIDENSLSQFLKNPELDALRVNINLYNKYKNNDNVVLIKYEDYLDKGSYTDLVNRLCEFFDVEASIQDRWYIENRFNKKSMKEKTDSIGTFSKHKDYYHGNHIGEKNLNYKSLFSREALVIFHKYINPYMEVYNA
jgi:hypothetical protein